MKLLGSFPLVLFLSLASCSGTASENDLGSDTHLSDTTGGFDAVGTGGDVTLDSSVASEIEEPPADATSPPDDSVESPTDITISDISPDIGDPPETDLCAAVDDHDQWELCESGDHFCAVVFTDSTGCSGVCDQLGLECYATWENIDDDCAPNTEIPPLSCDPPSGHQSDYCICQSPQTTCIPDCSGKACGDDGCGGPCGVCPTGTPCIDNQCQCVPKTCASELFHCGENHNDGCGGTFSCTGACPPEFACDQGFCGGPPAPCTDEDCPAFPGAEGEGMYAAGGRGGDVCHVTNLNNSGSGSLRKCAETQSGPRTIVFDVAGHIALNSSLQFDHNKLTLAGQTAPGDGIVISGYDVQFSADDLIVQHIRFRAGDDKAPNCPGGGDGFTEDSVTLKGSRIIVDHVSASWGIDENLSGGNEFKDMTVQYCIIAEGLWQTGLWHGECNEKYEPGGEKGHSMGGLFKPSIGDGDISIHHNLFAHNGNRNPAVGSYEDDQNFRADIRNNVIYNCPSMGYTSGTSEKVSVNYVGNYGIFGPSSKSDDLFEGNADNNLKLYRDDNRLDKDKDGTFDGIDHGASMFDGDFDTAGSPYTFKPVTTHNSSDVPAVVLNWAGAKPWSRDNTDERVIQDVYDNTGTLIDSPDEVGGVGNLDVGTSVVDTDDDGMPDDFESAYGTNPNSADHNGDVDGDGYTNLENYLHWASRPQ